VKKIINFPPQASRISKFLARTLMALCTAAILVGSAPSDTSAAVGLVKFEARCQADGSILVTWETSSEPDSLAFFLYRAESQNGPWDEYIDFEPAAGNPWTGVAYSFVDYEVTRGVNYWYRLEELAADYSSRWFGPILAGCGRANVPLVLCTP
jgi:hypothetical protein